MRSSEWLGFTSLTSVLLERHTAGSQYWLCSVFSPFMKWLQTEVKWKCLGGKKDETPRMEAYPHRIKVLSRETSWVHLLLQPPVWRSNTVNIKSGQLKTVSCPRDEPLSLWSLLCCQRPPKPTLVAAAPSFVICYYWDESRSQLDCL